MRAQSSIVSIATMFINQYDVAVIGCGHAGLEAALAASRIGAKVLVVTSSIDAIGSISCNPSIGGIGKGHLVKEIDALGGAMGILADRSCIHRKTLNSSKGPSARSTRFQVDRFLYKMHSISLLNSQQNITIVQDTVVGITKAGGMVLTTTKLDNQFVSRTLVISTGTFLNDKKHTGNGASEVRMDQEPTSQNLSDCLTQLGLEKLRMKTGTPARIDGRLVNFSLLTEQKTDLNTGPFSFINSNDVFPSQTSCWLSYTNNLTHQLILKSIELSPVYKQSVEGVGPRYCLSIEEKVLRFQHKDKHLVFIEPESLASTELYVGGLSTCLPPGVQKKMIRSIAGLENVQITRFGYAVEYDCFNPKLLKKTLESKIVERIYLAGQINGTTGYEEAAAQGLVAGINAANAAKSFASWSPDRQDCYIGVLVDDLVRHGVSEPYRIFTSRSEARLALREDNADFRLTPLGKKLNMVSSARWNLFCLKNKFRNTACRYEISNLWKELEVYNVPSLKGELLLQAIGREKLIIEQHPAVQFKEPILNYNYVNLPSRLNFNLVRGLSGEIIEKLNQIKPKNIGQAICIEGITPSMLALLLTYSRHTVSFNSNDQ